MMLVLAATALEKIQAVPLKLWLNLGLALLIFIAAVVIIKKASEMNKMVLATIIFVVLACVGMNWIYARNEPAFMTPLIEKIAVFFPTVEKKVEKERKQTYP